MEITRKDQQWLRMCADSAETFRTCSRRAYFAAIVVNNVVISTGYNGVPSGLEHCVDGGCPRGQSKVAHGSSYGPGAGKCLAAHAEINAIMKSNWNIRSLPGSTLYINGPPCWFCSTALANSGLSRVVCFPDDAYAEWPENKAYMEKAGIEVIEVARDLILP